MNKKRKCLSLFFALIFIPYFLCGQENKWQELNTLLNDGKYFESKRMYQEIHSMLSPDMDLYYKYWMAQFMDKNDSAVIYIEKMLTDYPEAFGNTTINTYAGLFEIYAVKLRNYEKSLYTYERMVQHLQENPFNLDEKELILWRNGNQSRVDCLKQLKNQPSIRIKRGETNCFAKLEDDKIMRVETKVNGIPQKTILDTGTDSHYIINRKEAERLNIKCAISEMSTGLINNTEILIKHVVVDSIEIGNITIYDVPTIIFEHDIAGVVPDSLENGEELLTEVDSLYANLTTSIVGLPIMQLIGKFLFDYEQQTVSFPIRNQYQDFSVEPNMYCYGKFVHTQLRFNGEDFFGVLDTGLTEYIKVDTFYFEKYKTSITAAEVAERKSYFSIRVDKLLHNMPYIVADDPIIRFNKKQMLPPAKDAVRIYHLNETRNSVYFDGFIGYDFFKRIGKKVLLDLDNMRLEAIE